MPAGKGLIGEAMRNVSIYLVVKDFEKSVSFYEKVLDEKVSEQNRSRFAMFSTNGIDLSIMNGHFDSDHLDEIKTSGEYIPKFDDMDKIADSENSRKVFINITVDDLKAEYNRILSLNIAEDITPVRYIEFASPYWYFSFTDPDGNPIEITGEYNK